MKIKFTLIVLSLVAAPVFASDKPVGKTREQVLAELVQAVKSGDMPASGESGLTLKQLNPSAYPATESALGAKTRNQARAELALSLRTGDIMAGGESGAKLNVQEPGRHSVIASAPSKTRDQVKIELARAIHEGDLTAIGEDGRKLNEIYPDRYHASHHAAASADADESAKASRF